MTRPEPKTPARLEPMNKYKYAFVIQGHYGHGWEDLTEEDARPEAKEQLKCYNENEPEISHRIIKRKEEPNE